MMHTYTPLTNVPTNCQPSTPDGIQEIAQKILKIMVTMTRSKVESRSYHDTAHLQPPKQCPYQVSTSYTLQFPRYGPDKIL